MEKQKTYKSYYIYNKTLHEQNKIKFLKELLKANNENKQDFLLEVERLYNEELERTENRNPSYGELAHIENLDLNELQALYDELIEAENEAADNV